MQRPTIESIRVGNTSSLNAPVRLCVRYRYADSGLQPPLVTSSESSLHSCPLNADSIGLFSGCVTSSSLSRLSTRLNARCSRSVRNISFNTVGCSSWIRVSGGGAGFWPVFGRRVTVGVSLPIVPVSVYTNRRLTRRVTFSATASIPATRGIPLSGNAAIVEDRVRRSRRGHSPRPPRNDEKKIQSMSATTPLCPRAAPSAAGKRGRRARSLLPIVSI